MTDDEWAIAHGFDFDAYEFTERVGIILDDDAISNDKQLVENARLQAAAELDSVDKYQLC